MHKRIKSIDKIGIVVLTILLLSSTMIAQSNFFVGLTSGYFSAGNNNNILQQYNDQGSFEKEMDDLHWTYGLTLGLRRKIGNSSLAFSWTNLQRKREAFKEDPPGTLFKEDVRYSFNTYDLALETHVGALSFGSSIGRRNVVVKTRIGSSKADRVIAEEANWTSRFFITFTSIGSDFNSISIRPFFEYSWNGTDISSLSQELINTKPNVSEKYHMFGISVIFYNGKQ